jgi:hypothetical protein
MSANTPHARLLNDAALEVLEPLGLTQVGRSRTWLDDHGWWLALVEFQPDREARGSYLNVGVMWLWRPAEEFSFDVGYRVGDFKTFRNKAQFEREALDMANRAAARIEKYRAMFSSLDLAAEYLVQHHDGGDPWARYHTGVACALTGRPEQACRCFDDFLELARRAGWPQSLLRRAVDLRTLAATAERFRLAIEGLVGTTRESLGLPRVAGAVF